MKGVSTSGAPWHVLLTTDLVGGVWDFCCVLTRELSRRGHRVTLLAFGEPSPAHRCQAAEGGAALLASPLKLEWMRDSARDVCHARTIVAEVVARQQPDILHTNQYALGSIDLPIPVVLTANSDVLSWIKWNTGAVPGDDVRHEWATYAAVVESGISGADAVVAVSRFVACELAALYGVCRDLDVIHNGWPVPAEVPRPVADRRRLTLLAGRAWDSAKNIAMAARAAQGWSPGRVLLAGEQRHPETGTAMEVAPPVQTLGHLGRPDLDRLLGHARLYLAPARYEPFGLLPLQAALAGCPLLLSDIPSFRELWDGAAFFFRADDEADLRRQWGRALRDEEQSARFAGRARAVAAERYAASRMADAYSELYCRLLWRSGQGAPSPRQAAS